ncbi:MAG: alpha-2-macroglobulin family protein [Candidatus Spyradenecus sp.]
MALLVEALLALSVYLYVWRVPERRQAAVQRLLPSAETPSEQLHPVTCESGQALLSSAEAPAVPAPPPPEAQTAAPQASPQAPQEATFFLASSSVYQHGTDFTVMLRFLPEAEFETAPALDLITVTPEVKDLTPVVDYAGRLDLRGEWQSGQTYQLTLHAGLKDSEGRTLPMAVTRAITIPDYKPSFQFLTLGRYLPLSRPRLPYRAVNLDPTESIQLSRGYENNLLPFGFTSWDARHLTRKIAQIPLLDQPLPRNVICDRFFDLGPFIGNQPGVYHLEASAPCPTWDGDAHRLIVTDLGIAWACDNFTGFGVSVRRLSTNEPVAGATIEVAGEKNQLLLRGTTDAAGLAMLSLVPGALESDDFPARKMIVRAEGGEQVYLSLSETAFEGRLYANGRTPQPAAALWLDRGAVRPGESLRATALVRQAGTTRPFANQPFKLNFYDERERLLHTATATSDAMGQLSADFTLPRTANDGLYAIALALNNEELAYQRFYVADFVPDRVKLALDLSPTQLNATAQTYFGVPVANARAHVTLRGECAPNLPAAWEGWQVGQRNASANDQENTLTSDEAGAFSLTTDLMTNRCYSAPARLRASVFLTEPGGRTVTATAATETLFTESAYIGLRESETSGMEATLLLPEGSTESAMEVEISLEKRTWRYITRRTDRGTYQREWVAQVDPREAPQRRMTLRPGIVSPVDLTGLEPGHYFITLTRVGDGAQICSTLDCWLGDAQAYASRDKRLNTLTLAFAPAPRRPGESLEVALDLPGPGTLLLAAGAERLQPLSSFEVPQAGRYTIPVQLPADLTCSRFPIAVTFTTANADCDNRLTGRAELPVDQSAQALDLRLEAPALARPGTELPITLTLPQSTTDTARQVTLWAVDEGVLAVSRYALPDPLADLTDLPGTLTSGDLYGLLFPDLAISPEGRIGGGAGNDMGAFENRPLARVLFDPVAVGPDGRVSLSLTVPEDFQGQLRLMAIATDAEGRVGRAQQIVTCRAAISLALSAPEALCPGDTAELTLTVTNLDLPEGPFTLTAFGGQELARGILPPNKPVTFTHRFTVPERLSEIAATVTMGETAVSQRERLYVRPAVPNIRAVTYTRLAPGEPLPEGAEAVSLADFRARTDAWFADYPFNCTEQLSAKAWPCLLNRSDLDREVLRQVVAQLRPRHIRGLFRLWPTGDCNLPASLMAAHVVLTAIRTQAVPDDEDLRESLHETLRDVARANDTPTEAAFAAWILAHDKAFGATEFAQCLNLTKLHPTEGSALFAAAALIRAGYASEGIEPFKRAYAAPEAPREPYYIFRRLPYYMDASAWRAAKVALALEAGLPVSEEAFAALFAADWRTTQANAWGGYAFSLATTLPESLRLAKQVREVPATEGTRVRDISRTLVNAQGQPITELAHGDLAFVRIDFVLPRDVNDLAVRDFLPGGLVYEDGNLATRESLTRPDWAKGFDSMRVAYTRKRPGEVAFFGAAQTGDESVVLVYPVRATTRGTFSWGSCVIEAMYDPDLTGVDAPAGTLTVK